MEDFKNRLQAFIESLSGVSYREFERKCGLAQGTITSIKVKGPSVEVLMKISSTFPDLDMNWLISGRGEMLLPEKRPEDAAPIRNDIHHNDYVCINYGELKDVIIKAIKEAKQ